MNISLRNLSIFLIYSTWHFTVDACTNFLVSREASSEDANMISYNADAGNFYATIYHYPATLISNNETKRKVW